MKPASATLTNLLRRGLLVLLLSPFLYLGVRSLVEFDVDTYRKVFDVDVWSLLWRTLRLAVGATVVAGLLGGPVAVVFEARSFPVPGFFRVLAFTPLLIPPVFQVAVWERLAVPGGVLSTLLPFFAPQGEHFPLRNITCAICILGVSYSPLFFFFTSQGLRSVPRELIDAARIHQGAGRTFLRVQLPLALPAVLVGCGITFTFSCLNYEVPRLLDVTTYPVLVNLKFEAENSPGVAFLFALPLFLLAAGLLLASQSWADRRGFSLTSGERDRVSEARSRPGVPAWTMFSLWWGISVLLPLAVLLALAGSPKVFAEAFTTDWEKIFWSTAVSLATALLSVALASLSLRPGEVSGRPWRVLLWLPIALSGSLLGSAIIHMRGWVPGWMLPLYDGPWALVFAGALRFFPLAYFALLAHMRAVPRSQWQAARFQGCVHRRVRSVVLPLEWPGLLTGGLAVALFQSQELAATILLAPPGYEPLILRIYNLLHYDPERSVLAALCIYQIAGVVSVVGLFLLWDRWTGETRSPR